MPIRISHEGNIGQALGMTYAGALGQRMDKERARLGQQALGYAGIRARQENLAFQADHQRAMAEMKMEEDYWRRQDDMAYKQEVAKQGHLDQLARINTTQGFYDNRQKKELAARKRAAAAVEEQKVRASKEGWEWKSLEWEDENIPQHIKGIDLSEIADQLTPKQSEAWEEIQNREKEIKLADDDRPENKYRARQKLARDKWALMDTLTPDQRPKSKAERWKEGHNTLVHTPSGVVHEDEYDPNVHGEQLGTVVTAIDPNTGKSHKVATFDTPKEKPVDRGKIQKEYGYDAPNGQPVIPNTTVVEAIRKRDAGEPPTAEEQSELEMYEYKRDLSKYEVKMEKWQLEYNTIAQAALKNYADAHKPDAADIGADKDFKTKLRQFAKTPNLLIGVIRADPFEGPKFEYLMSRKPQPPSLGPGHEMMSGRERSFMTRPQGNGQPPQMLPVAQPTQEQPIPPDGSGMGEFGMGEFRELEQRLEIPEEQASWDPVFNPLGEDISNLTEIVVAAAGPAAKALKLGQDGYDFLVKSMSDAIIKHGPKAATGALTGGVSLAGEAYNEAITPDALREYRERQAAAPTVPTQEEYQAANPPVEQDPNQASPALIKAIKTQAGALRNPTAQDLAKIERKLRQLPEPTDEEYEAMPSGTRYLDDDGVVKKKP